jgi:site-specific DNA-methyltransferase (adenine-specific)
MKPYYDCDGITIYHGDCREILPELPKVDLVLTDPPYGVTQNKWDIPVDLKSLWIELYKISKDDTPYLFTSVQPFTADLINSNRDNFKYDLIWYKALGTGFLNSKKMPMRNHENILIFYKKLSTFNPQMVKGKMRNKGRHDGPSSSNYGHYNGHISKNDIYYPQSVIDITNGDKSTDNFHPTQKPVQLMAYLMETYSNKDNTILDPFMGSGTTLVAAKQLHRQAIGIEIEEKYCEIAVKRLAQGVLPL